MDIFSLFLWCSRLGYQVFWFKKKYHLLVQNIIPRLELLFMHKTTLIFSSFSISKEFLCLLHDFGSVSHSLTISQAEASQMIHWYLDIVTIDKGHSILIYVVGSRCVCVCVCEHVQKILKYIRNISSICK